MGDRASRTGIVLIVCVIAFAFFFAGNAHADPLGSDIVCLIYTKLDGFGSPIPFLQHGDCPQSPQPPAPPPPAPSPPAPAPSPMPSPPPTGELIINTVVINNDSGTSTPSDFTVSVGTSSSATMPVNAATTTVGIGTWTVYVAPKTGYTISFGGDCNAQGQVTVSASTTKACTITADDVAPASNSGDASSATTTQNNGNQSAGGAFSAGSSGGGGVPSSSSGSSSGGGGGSGSYLPFTASAQGSGGIVLSAATDSISRSYSPEEIASCDRYLTAFIKSGKANDAEQVTRLQKFLRDFERANTQETGMYNAATLAAVNAFQTKYAADILTPWGIQQSTGFVYLTTRKKVNEIFCKNTRTFLLTPDELVKIADARDALLTSQNESAKKGGATKNVIHSSTKKSANVSDATLKGSSDHQKRINPMFDFFNSMLSNRSR